MKRVRFTGKRSGLPGFRSDLGLITRGTVVELDDARATAWVSGGDFEPAGVITPGTRILSKAGESFTPQTKAKPAPKPAPKPEARTPRTEKET